VTIEIAESPKIMRPVTSATHPNILEPLDFGLLSVIMTTFLYVPQIRAASLPPSMVPLMPWITPNMANPVASPLVAIDNPMAHNPFHRTFRF
jgi:hypothetical protein